MAATTTALALLAAGQAGSQYLYGRKAAKGVEAMGRYEAGILEQNAGFSEQQAKDSIAIGEDQASRHKAAVRGLIGSQRVAAAASGIAIDSGSALDLQEEAAGLGELDLLTIRQNAKREAWGYKVQASNYRGQAAMARAGAKGQAASIRNEGYTTLLTAGAQIGSMYAYGGGGPKVPRYPAGGPTLGSQASFGTGGGWGGRPLPNVRR